MTTSPLTIGDLAKSTGTKVVTICYYERIGLLPRLSARAATTALTSPCAWTGCVSSGVAVAWASR